MSQVVVTARIDAETAAKLDRIGNTYDRKRAWMIARAIARYAEEGCAYLDMIQEGLDDLETGRVVSHEEITAKFERRFRKAEAA